jgi:hypothetical protein
MLKIVRCSLTLNLLRVNGDAMVDEVPPARIPAEMCPACGETFHPDRPGVGERCTTCQYHGREPLPPLPPRPANPYSRTGLARLVVSDLARDIADRATGLALTMHDEWSRSCDKLESALQLRTAVDELVAAAVVYARERGASWSDVADVLEVKKQTAHERWAGVEQEWHDGLMDPLRTQPKGRLRYLAVPNAAYDPQRYATSLDGWALQHVSDAQLREWREQGKDAEHPVSAQLPLRTAVNEVTDLLAHIRWLTGRREPMTDAERHELAVRKAAVFERIAIERGNPDVAALATRLRQQLAGLDAAGEDQTS